MIKLLLPLLLLGNLYAYEPTCEQIGLSFAKNVKLSEAQKQQIIYLSNKHILAAYRLFDELRDLHWYIPRRSLQEMTGDAIKGAVSSAHSKNGKAIVFAVLYTVVSELASTSWDQYWEFKDTVEKADYEYGMHLFYLQILRNDK